MDINALRIFKTVAEEESISKAAGRLDYVQSNVTARIKQLEDDLDSLLFYRKTRGMALTPAGRTLMEYTDRILQLIEEAEKAVQDNGEVKGKLAIGSLESTAAVRLPSILTRYHQTYPKVDMTLKTGTSEDLQFAVLDYKVEGAFVAGSVEHAEIIQTPVFEEELVFVTEPGIESLEALNGVTMLVFRQGCTYRSQLEHFLRANGMLPYKIMEFGSLEAILGCVTAGMGVTLFPRSVVAGLNYAPCLRMHAIPPTFGQVPTMFIRRKDAIETKAMAAFLETVTTKGVQPVGKQYAGR
ncbi:MAG: LysR family transcriptional regulator [Anaerolineae bacterium]|nr:LysR family transcriptional regulator [Anaerolineae bacterium]